MTNVVFLLLPMKYTQVKFILNCFIKKIICCLSIAAYLIICKFINFLINIVVIASCIDFIIDRSAMDKLTDKYENVSSLLLVGHGASVGASIEVTL